MKKHYIIISLLTSILLFSCTQKESKKSIAPKLFTNPPQETKVHTWWHWIEGSVTKEGITKDLESMKKQGIVQATILNIGLFQDKDFGIKKVDFNTPEWYDMFHWALEEASRLNISIGVHNCDGWSSSGGPWITPEKAMKNFTWTKQYIKGGKHINLKLTKPFAVNDFYKQVAVLACKTENEASSFIKASPKTLLNDSAINYLYDGSPLSGTPLKIGSNIKFVFDEDFTAEKLVIHTRQDFTWGNPDSIGATFSLWYLDNNTYKKIKSLKTIGINKTTSFDIPKTRSKSFMLKIDGLKSRNSWIKHTIGEVELLKKDESPSYSTDITNLQAKTGTVLGTSPYDYTYENKKNGISPENIIDLSSNVSDNKLEWDVPEGNWTIIQFGYTITGAKNGPATKNGVGLECDKMDNSAIDLHYSNFPQKLVEHAGEYAGNTFKFLLVDSWECSFQNWTDKFPEAFNNLNGYSINQWIPVLCGETVENIEQSEAFLYDFRSTISNLIENNYYKHFSELCHKSDLEFHCEVIYGGGTYPSLDILKTSSYVDLPMFEFWTGVNSETKRIEYNPENQRKIDFPQNVAMFYNKPAIGSEAYTGNVHFSESPQEIKIYGDRAFCFGVSQMILHSYVHQPDERKPGMTLLNWGLPFNRHNPYWDYASAWMTYQARIQYILQNSNEFSDILYFVGDQLPQYSSPDYLKDLPKGYNTNICNYDILKNKLFVEDGKIKTDQGLEFSILLLPNQKSMNFTTLQHLEKLIKQGAVVYGPKPTQMLSKSDIDKNQDAFKALSDTIWGGSSMSACLPTRQGAEGKPLENSFGKGKVLWNMSLSDALKNIELKPDFADVSGNESNFLYIHKKVAGTDYYFVVNQLKETVDAKCAFRTVDKKVELWNPENGSVSSISNVSEKDNTTVIPFKFEDQESAIFVFKNEQTDGLKELKKEFAQTFEVTDFEGSIEFSPAYDKKIDKIKISDLRALSEYENEDIKYFSGKAKYTIEFDFTENNTDGLYLNLGKLDADADVILNGENLGYAWLAYQRFDISKIIKAKNTLEVTVAIPYRNRFLGDLEKYGDQKTIWTSAYIKNIIGNNPPLKPCGLMGPITIGKY